jgi:hypothetical protein
MDLGDITQLVLVATTALVLGRLGLALARSIERRSSGQPGLPGEVGERFLALEDECLSLRQELTELQERQDFTERAFLHDTGQGKPLAPKVVPEPAVTPR